MRHIQTEGGDAVQLSPRERSTLSLVMRGFETKEIAHALSVSEFTVKDYLRAIRSATGCKNRTELFAWAMTHPGALAGIAVGRAMHSPGCSCSAPYCSTMRQSAA